MIKRSIGLGILVLVLTGYFMGQQDEKPGIIWQTDYEKAVQLAEEKGMPILVFFMAAWSTPSKMMLEKVWVNDSVVSQAQKFVAVQVDVDRYPEIAKKYEVKTYPTVIFSDPSGEIEIRKAGIVNPNEIVTLMKVFPLDFRGILDLKRKIEVGSKDFESLRQLAEFYARINVWDLSSEYYKQALKNENLANNEELKDLIVFSLAMNELRMKHYEEAQRLFEEEIKEYPKEKSTENLLYGLIIAYIGQNKMTEAEKTYKKLKSKYPDSKVTEHAGRILEMMKKRIRVEKEGMKEGIE
jgi:tetratricopeptide (TPR) repeat protein